MLNFQNNISLRQYNTFGIDAKAKSFINVKDSNDLVEILSQNSDQEILVIGGGSNLLLTKDYPGLIISIQTKGIEIIKEDKKEVIIKVQAGENWHEFVLWCLEHNLAGIENLALIPGSVGAAPLQNIGAYGVELKDVFHDCEALSIATKKLEIFNLNACDFGYRSSVFKTILKGKYIINSVSFKLKKEPHWVNTSYRGLEEHLQGKEKTIQNVARAVIEIRSSKLPDPKIIGNSGSFFKNPIIPIDDFKKLELKHPDVPNYPDKQGWIKIPAAWLIDTLGYKGYRNNDAGVHQNQALVLVNYGNAKGSEIKALAEKIKTAVQTQFSIDLEFEVNII